jgi:hypothetical protein
VELLVREGVLPVDRVTPFLGLSAHDVIQLCGLEPSYFSAPGRVVELATLRSARATNAPADEQGPAIREAAVLPFAAGRRR